MAKTRSTRSADVRPASTPQPLNECRYLPKRMPLRRGAISHPLGAKRFCGVALSQATSMPRPVSWSDSSMRPQTEHPRDSHKPSVKRPQRRAGQGRRSQQVHLDPAETPPLQLVRIDECQDFAMPRDRRLRKIRQQRKHPIPRLQIAAGEFADNEWMRFDLTGLERLRQGAAAATQMIDPDRGVDEHGSVSAERPDGAGAAPAKPVRKHRARRAAVRFRGQSGP